MWQNVIFSAKIFSVELHFFHFLEMVLWVPCSELENILSYSSGHDTSIIFTLMRYHEGLIATELQSRTSVAPHEIFVRI